MKYAIDPYVGAGDIHFGMSVDAVRSTVGEAAKPFLKSSTSHHRSDLFENSGIVVYYSASAVCEAIEFNGPAIPVFGEQPLMPLSLDDLEAWLQDADPDAQIDIPDVTSNKLGIGFFIKEDHVASVIAFAKGYFK